MTTRRDVGPGPGTRHALAFLTLAGWLAGVTAAQAVDWRHLTEAEGLRDRKVQCVRRIGDTVRVGTMKGLTAFREGEPAVVVTNVAVWEVAPAGEDLAGSILDGVYVQP